MAQGRFCAGCGAPLAPDAAESAAAEARRQRKEMRLIAAGLAAVMAISAILVVYHSRRSGSATSGALQQQTPASAPNDGTSDLATESPADPSQTSQPVSGPGDTPVTVESATPASPQPSAPVQQVVHTPASDSRPPLDMSPGVDRYPGSEPINIDQSKVPDMGVPISTEAYTTTDSVATVVEYYRQRYPDAKISEMQGQQVIAVERNGTAKVIAVGTNGNETRIAIVQPN